MNKQLLDRIKALEMTVLVAPERFLSDEALLDRVSAIIGHRVNRAAYSWQKSEPPAEWPEELATAWLKAGLRFD